MKLNKRQAKQLIASTLGLTLTACIIGSTAISTAAAFHVPQTNASLANNTARMLAQGTGTVNYVEEDAIDVMYDVWMIPQQTKNSCWAAAAAMILSWRDQASYSPEQIARYINRLHEYHHKYRIDDHTLFSMVGMVAEPPQSYSVKAFATMLNEYGPLWVATQENDGHVQVVTGMSGDGTPEGTVVYLNDPWGDEMNPKNPSKNRGRKRVESYAKFVRKQAKLARRSRNVDNAFYVAHLR